MVVGQPYWTFKAPLPQPRLAPAMVVLGGKPLLTGGSYEVSLLLQELLSLLFVDTLCFGSHILDSNETLIWVTVVSNTSKPYQGRSTTKMQTQYLEGQRRIQKI